MVNKHGDKIIILDGGGTIWYSMDVLWEHYQAAFSHFGLLRPDEFAVRFPPSETTEISSLRSFNSRKNIPKALLALHFSNLSVTDLVDEQSLYNRNNLEDQLHNLVLQSWGICSRFCFEELVEKMGKFLEDALYNYNDTQYPLCKNAKQGLLLSLE